jgi:mycothiol synthase
MPTSVAFRPPRPEDAAAVTALLNACSVAEIGVPDSTVEDVRSSWERPGRQMDGLILAEAAGRIVGYLELDARAPWTSFWIDGYVHPEATGRGIGSGLLDQGEDRARVLAAHAPPGEAVVMYHGVWHGSPGAPLLERRGYALSRVFWKMRIEMDGPPLAPVIPESLTIRTVRPGEEAAVHEASEEAFADHWEHRPTPFERWFHDQTTHRGYDPALWFLGVDGGQIAGVVIARQFDSEEPDAGYIEDVSVRRPWRRRGLALALLLHAFGELYRRGIRTAVLDVDAESAMGAPRLYERAGMSVQRRIDVYRLELISAGAATAAKGVTPEG